MTITTVISQETKSMIKRTLTAFDITRDNNNNPVSWGVKSYSSDATDPLVFGIKSYFGTKGQENHKLVLEAIKLLENVDKTGAYKGHNQLLDVSLGVLYREFQELQRRYLGHAA